jgi:hypothetical protein
LLQGRRCELSPPPPPPPPPRLTRAPALLAPPPPQATPKDMWPLLLADLMRLVGQKSVAPQEGAPAAAAAGRKAAALPGSRRGAGRDGAKGLPAKAAEIDKIFG